MKQVQDKSLSLFGREGAQRRLIPLLCAVFLFFAGIQPVLADTNECVYQPAPADVSPLHVFEPLPHGINLSRWWQDNQDRPLSVQDIRRIRDSGFDFVRLPVSVTWLTIRNPEEQNKKLEALNCDIVSLLNENFHVVLALDAPDSFQDELAKNPSIAVSRLEDVWRKLQPLVSKLPPGRIFLGLYDSPLIESGLWWRMQARILDDLHPLFPDSTFVVSPGPFNGWWNLTNKQPYKDPNIIYDFHFYDPMVLTHHGAEWLSSTDEDRTSSPIAYPVTKSFHFDMDDPAIKNYVGQNWTRTSIFKIMEDIGAWRDLHRVRVACLEFGMYRPYIDDKSRYNWLHDVRDALEVYHLPWAVWEYSGGFGLLDPQGKPDQGMLDALSLKFGPVQRAPN